MDEVARLEKLEKQLRSKSLNLTLCMGLAYYYVQDENKKWYRCDTLAEVQQLIAVFDQANQLAEQGKTAYIVWQDEKWGLLVV